MTTLGSLHHLVVGRGEPGLVLIPPNPVDLTYWAYQQAHFSTWFRTLAVDLPGYGHSAPVRRPVTLEELAEAVWTTVDAAELESVVVVGASMGSAVALHMKDQRRARCAGLVLTGCSYRSVKTFAERRLDGYRTAGAKYRETHLLEGYSAAFRTSAPGRYLIRAALERGHLVDVDSVIRLFEAHLRPDPEHLFEDAVPTLVITGTEDYAHDGAAALAERIAGSELAVIEGAGHSCSQEVPWEWDRLVLDFLHRRVLSSRRT